MKYSLPLFLVALLMGACNKHEFMALSPAGAPSLMPIDSINGIIWQEVNKSGPFDWEQASDRLLWSAIAQSGQLVSLGYRVPGIDEGGGFSRINEEERLRVRETLLQLVWASEREVRPDLKREALEVWPDNELPVMDILIGRFETLQLLRRSSLVRYVEPMDYETQLGALTERQSGCQPNMPVSSLVAGVHYGVMAPFAKASWNYPHHGILDAWRSVSGKGIKVFLIDTGISYDQENLGSAFNQGFSGGRKLERLVTLPRKQFLGVFNVGPVETPEDRCGHGTAMAGVIAAPRGDDGNMVGVAYNANLVSCRAAEDVFIDAAREVRGVSDAFVMAAGTTDVRIISMSMGRITVSSQIKDAILYAKEKGKLIFCAAGTSWPFTAGWAGVIFPASMSEVQAVTGIKQGHGMTACDQCHSGPEVDFAVVMERSADGHHPLTVSDRGDDPSVIGGSSVATASMAGMAALVWSRYPWLEANQLLAMLQRYSSSFPIRNNRFGWGKFQPALALD